MANYLPTALTLGLLIGCNGTGENVPDDSPLALRVKALEDNYDPTQHPGFDGARKQLLKDINAERSQALSDIASAKGEALKEVNKARRDLEKLIKEEAKSLKAQYETDRISLQESQAYVEGVAAELKEYKQGLVADIGKDDPNPDKKTGIYRLIYVVTKIHVKQIEKLLVRAEQVVARYKLDADRGKGKQGNYRDVHDKTNEKLKSIIEDVFSKNTYEEQKASIDKLEPFLQGVKKKFEQADKEIERLYQKGLPKK